MSRRAEDPQFTLHYPVEYPGHDPLVSLPDFVDVEIDDSIVLDESNAYTGVRIGYGPNTTEAEVFYDYLFSYDTAKGTDLVELYPLDGSDDVVSFEVSGVLPQELAGNDEKMRAVIKLALLELESR